MTRIRMLQAGLILSVLLCALGLAATAAAPQEKKHSDPSKSCVSKDCHPDIVKHKYKHGPIVVGNCTVCHAPLPGDQHKFRVEKSDAKLCATCHKQVNTEPNLHDPVAKGQCLKCHDPHGSEERYQVRVSPQVKMCDECHKPVLTRKYTHKPVADGQCLSCHRPHGSKATKLLDDSGSKLCLKQCHEKMRPVIVAGKEQKAHLASEDCTKCHRSHDSSYPSLLTRSPAELCLDGCHKEFKEDSNKFKHWAAKNGSSCIDCHRAHNSTFGHLLRKPGAELCFTCHEELQAQIAAAKFKHRPVSDNRCPACHLPHSSKYGKLLFADYPSATAAVYDLAKYALCFTCHADRIVRERYVVNQTNFRNGRLNLHYLHVNRENEGSTCGACHDAHASSQPAQIRERAPTGNWAIPVKFTKSKDGGSCLTGCHKEYTYDRVNPVQLSAE